MDDLLCFHTQETIYGIPLKYVEETLAKQKITKVPRLNDKLSGSFVIIKELFIQCFLLIVY